MITFHDFSKLERLDLKLFKAWGYDVTIINFNVPNSDVHILHSVSYKNRKIIMLNAPWI